MGHKLKYLKSFVSRFHREKKIEKMKMIAAFVLLCAVASTQALTWKSCGGDALKIKKLEVTQDPIVFPGPIDAVLEAETTQDMDAPIKIEMELKKNGLVLPCIPIGDKMLGSCTYADICQTLAKIPSKRPTRICPKCPPSSPSWPRVKSPSRPKPPVPAAKSSDALNSPSTLTLNCKSV